MLLPLDCQLQFHFSWNYCGGAWGVDHRQAICLPLLFFSATAPPATAPPSATALPFLEIADLAGARCLIVPLSNFAGLRCLGDFSGDALMGDTPLRGDFSSGRRALLRLVGVCRFDGILPFQPTLLQLLHAEVRLSGM